MKRKLIYLFTILCLSTIPAMGQARAFFNTIGRASHKTIRNASCEDSTDLRTSFDSVSRANDSLDCSKQDYSMLSVEQLESLISQYQDLVDRKRLSSEKKPSSNSRILSYYEGESHDLTMDNLISVVGEVGLSNQLFVLAQAVLETGHFKSRVCNEYHNLFGLYDSRHHDYYRFARWEDSVIGYQKFIQYRYKGGNYLNFLDRIGYAEGKGYTKKVAQIARQLYRQLFPD